MASEDQTKVISGELGNGRVFARRYEIERKLGRGGMGVVYKALDKLLDIPVALKTMNPDIAHDERILSRLKREVVLARKISHPNVCRIYDIGESEGIHYVSMELLEGKTLAELLLERGAIPVTESLLIIKQILDAVEAAHAVGVLHRDLKPQNIHVDSSGRAHLMDFGISISNDVTRLTQTGRTIGTPLYMAPEQFSDEKPDARSDIYSLGMILFEIITGALPYEANTPASVMYAHLHQAPRKPSELISGLPPVLEKILLKALEKRPENRFQTVAEFRAALEPFLSFAANQPLNIPSSNTTIAPTVPIQRAGQQMPPAMASTPQTIPSAAEPVAVPAAVKKKSYSFKLLLILPAVLGAALLILLLIRSAPRPTETPAPVAEKTAEQPAIQNDSSTQQNMTVEETTTSDPQPSLSEAATEEVRADTTVEPEMRASTEEPESQPAEPVAPRKQELPATTSGPPKQKAVVPSKAAGTNQNLPAPAPPPPAIETEGTISFQAPFPVKIFIGQNLLMDSSLHKSQKLKPGTYTLTLSSKDRAFIESFRQKIEVRAGENTVISPPPVGYLSFRAEPSECRITIDETYQVAAPLQDLPLLPGKHRIFVEWRSLEVEEEVTIQIRENERTRLRGFVTSETIGIEEE